MSESTDEGIVRLNQEQNNAVESIINGWDSGNEAFFLPVVEGPPGTGKTLIGTIAADRFRGERRVPQVTYLCYTHFAADRALDGFRELGLTPDHVKRLVDTSQRKRYEHSPESAYYVAFNDANSLTENQKRRLRRTPILITTIISARKAFDFQTQPLVIFDEYSQIPPHLFYATISKLRYRNAHNPAGYALLGDPNQLPYITSQRLLRSNIGLHILNRRPHEPHRLVTQYRMHPHICQSVNALRRALNAYLLESHPSTTNKTLESMGYSYNESAVPANITDIFESNSPCVIINTDGLSGEEEIGWGNSTYNDSEAQLAAILSTHFHAAYEKDGSNLEPMIISPYNAQIGAIKQKLPESLRNNCISVHRAQGREYPCVIISFTRKNLSGNIGFLNKLRAQSYVACSRAEAKLIVLISRSTFYGRDYTDFNNLIDMSDRAIMEDADQSWIE